MPGADFDSAPRGFRPGRTHEVVGHGADAHQRAREVLLTWGFLPEWARVHPPGAEPRPGDTLLMVVRTNGLWSVLPARVVDREEAEDRAAFTYAAIQPHVAHGYERFAVQHDPTSDAVTFEIAAVARPALPALRVALPVFRISQQRFRRSCMEGMRSALSS